jgi:hypothetical protein
VVKVACTATCQVVTRDVTLATVSRAPERRHASPPPSCRRTAIPRPARGLCARTEELASAAHAPRAAPRAGSRAGHAARAHAVTPVPSLPCTPAEAGRTHSTIGRASPRCNSLAPKHLVARTYKRDCSAFLRGHTAAGMPWPPSSQVAAPLTPPTISVATSTSKASSRTLWFLHRPQLPRIPPHLAGIRAAPAAQPRPRRGSSPVLSPTPPLHPIAYR